MQYQRRNQEIIEAFPDSAGNMHIIHKGVLSDGVYPKAEFEREYQPAEPPRPVPAPMVIKESTPPGKYVIEPATHGTVAPRAPAYDPKWTELYPNLYGPDAKDPDEGSGDLECSDAIAQIMNKFTGIGGTFSTWSERHAFIYGAQIGYLHVKSSADVPPTPAFWLDESHYWMTGIIMGRAAAKLETAGLDLKYVIGLFTAGGISLTAVWKLILPMIGIN